ncbi:MAG: hypothetical protein GF347_03980 [Candidatus Moranbacteria bacterium]|nr:hypothetical protein [Candidatus Moranbacteria bacterium]
MKTFKINLSKDIAGNDVDINGYRLGSGAPKIYIQGGIHGGEITYWILHKLIKKIKNKKLNGAITIIPICNPYSWQQRNYFYTCGKFSYYNGADWNRFFPGDKTGNLFSMLAYKIFNEARKHEIIIDLHTSRKSKPFGIYADDKSKDLIKVLGFKYNQILKSEITGKSGTLNQACSDLSMQNVAIECGSHDDYNYDNVAKCVDSLLNLFKYTKVIAGTVKKAVDVNVFEENKSYYAPKAGFAKYVKKIGEQFKKGDVLFELYSSSNIERIIKVKAEEEGVLFKISPTHILQEGDSALQIIKKEDLKRI